MDRFILKYPGIDELISSKAFSKAARLLLEEQKKSWTDLKKNYDSLKSTKEKVFSFNRFTIKAQYNPGRIKSTTAKVDKKSINERECFLCSDNLYEGQKAIRYGEDFLILVNPFPIFPEHFTIPHKDHIPQTVKESFNMMLSLSKDLSGYVVIYNGPECGASAPDHLHFQACNKFFMPIDNEIHFLKNTYAEILTGNYSLSVAGIDDGLRRFIAIETIEMGIAEKVFDLLHNIYSKVAESSVEPMMNIISFYDEKSGWRIIIFLRERHRPSHYFRDGEDRILLSPAAVDLGGVCILPMEKDFNKITKGNIIEIFKEVSFCKERFGFVKAELKKALNE